MPHSAFVTMILRFTARLSLSLGALLVLFLTLPVSNSYASLTFTYMGRFLAPDGVSPLTDTANLTFKIYNPDQTCLLEQETFSNVDFSLLNGMVALSIGTGTRSGSDPALNMDTVVSNRPGVLRAPGADCAGGYSPNPLDGRILQVHVEIPSRSVATDLSPALRLEPVPLAYEAQKLQGYQAADFVRVQAPVNQVNLTTLTDGSNADALHRHDNYVKHGAANAGFSVLANNTIGLGQFAGAEPATGSVPAGSIWFNPNTQELRYYDGVINASVLGGSTTAPTHSFVRRDGSGNFSASTITANLIGNATTATSATTATNALAVSGTVVAPTGGLRVGVSQLTTSSSGNVGIGTASPSGLLEILASGTSLSSGIRMTGSALDTSTDSTQGLGIVLVRNATGNRQLGFADTSQPQDSAHSLVRMAIVSDVPRIDASSTDGGTEKQLQVGNTAGVALNGNVGIGTTTPAHALHVEGNTNGEVGIRNQNIHAGNAAFSIYRQYTDVGGGEFVIFTNSSTRTNDGGAANTTLRTDVGNLFLSAQSGQNLSLLASGNVGVGTTAPSSALHVIGVVTASSGFAGSFSGTNGSYSSNLSVSGMGSFGISGGTGSNPAITASFGGNSDYNAVGDTSVNGNLFFPGAGWQNGYFSYYPHTSIGSGMFRITGQSSNYGDSPVGLAVDGKLGIGTTSPQAKLHVYGGSAGGTYNGDAKVVIESSAGNVLQMKAGTSNYNALYIGDSTENGIGGVVVTSSSYPSTPSMMTLYAGSSNINLLPNGKIGIGTNAPGSLLTLYTPGGGSPVGAMSIDVATFSNGANAAASYFFRVRDTGGSATPFYIQGTGNVGIGTTAPSSVLHVVGTVTATSGFSGSFSGTTGTYSGALTASSGLTVTGGESISGGLNNNSGGITNAGAISGAGSIAASGVISVTGSLVTTGFVGIGTPSPLISLDVTGSGSGGMFVRDLAGAGGTLKFTNAGGANYIQSGVSTAAASAADLYFTDMHANRIWMTLSSAGNLGLGTTSPTQRLSLVGAATGVNQGVPASTGTTSSATIRMNGGVGGEVLDMGMNVSPSYAWLQATNSSALGTVYPLLLNPVGGNVGIGTTTPQNALDVFGVDGGVNQVRSTVMGGAFVEMHRNASNAEINVSANQDLFLQSSSSGKIIMAGGGNVGIGTTAPSSALHVIGVVTASSGFSGSFSGTTGTYSGALTASSGITVSAGGATIGGIVTANSGINVNSQGILNAGSISGISNLTGSGAVTLSTTGANSLTFSPSGTTAMTITSGGNVGIGTTTPSGIFQAVSGAKSFLIDLSSNASDSIIKATSNNTNSWVRFGTGGSPLGILTTGNDVNGSTPSIYVGNTGKIGLSTNSPGAKLHVYDNTAETTSAQTTKIEALKTSSTDGITKTGLEIQSTGAWAGSGAVNIGLNVNATGAAINYAALFSGGNVGIGTTSPVSLLDVSGSSSNLESHIHNTLATGYSVLRVGQPDTSIQTSANVQYNNSSLSSNGIYQPNQAYFSSGTNASNGILIGSQATGAPIVFGVNGFPGTEAMRITAGGNVGIGTNTPTSLLNVYGGNLLVSGPWPDSGTNSREMTVKSGQGTLYQRSWSVNGGGIYGEISFSDYFSGADHFKTLALNPQGGYVGIGTTAPSSALHVIGVVTASSGFSGTFTGTSGTFSSGLTVSSGGASITGLVESTSGGFKFPNGTIQTTAAGAGQIFGGFSNVYLPTSSGSAVQVVNSAGFTVSSLTPANISVALAGVYIGNIIRTRVIANTWNTGTAGQVTFYAGFYDGTYTKFIGICLSNNASGVTAYQFAAYYALGNVLASSAWTTSGGIPSATAVLPQGSDGYGVFELSITN